MAVEDIHEDADPGHRVGAHSQLVRRGRLLDRRHQAIRRADDQIRRDRRNPWRIAKEVCAPGGQDEANPEDWRPEPAKEQADKGERRNEGKAFAADRHKDRADRADYRRHSPSKPNLPNHT